LFLGYREHDALSAGVHHDEAVRQDGVALLFTGNAGHGFPGANEPALKIFGWLPERRHRSTGKRQLPPLRLGDHERITGGVV